MARFDEDPNDDYEHAPCPDCDNGNVKLNESKTYWECDVCDFKTPNTKQRGKTK